ncbi:hypothetical protein Droror1_Dr00020244 [Drosera rotundifolia]
MTLGFDCQLITHRGMDSHSLRPVSDLPQPLSSTFNFRYFNSLQSECFPACFLSDMNMVISAPTGSGKTVLFELCILRLFSKFLCADGRFVHTKGTLKTVYVAPSKALVQEKLRDWNQKLGSWGIVCLELTSDSGTYGKKDIQQADVILSTPEKFDAITRYSIKDGGLSFFSDISLLLIDEVHILNDPRGASLEAIVSRMKMLSRRLEIKSCPLASIRFVAVSATMPNLQDIAEWLTVPYPGMKRFGEEMRPVKLTTKVFGYAAAKNDFLFEKRLQNYIFDIIMQYSRGKLALIFCSTRKGAQEAAQKIASSAMTFGHSNPFIKTREQYERLREASSACSDKQMQSCISYGVGYHHGGLCMKDRSLIENLFLNGDIQILCTTNTLAHGINLPAHTVVIKSTQHFNKEKGLYMEYDHSTILQMCGRAGRPPFDDTGLVIIMTRRETVHLYENLLNGCEMVESQLLPCITEHLTAEIVQLTVPDITRAIEWMKCSYLYVRIKKNPENYGVKKGICADLMETYMQEPGRLMTKYYLKFDTMKCIMQTDANCRLEDLLHIVCRAEELSWIQLRRNEKKLLNDINIDKAGRLRFHIDGDKGKRKKRIQTREEKLFVLANDCLTGDPLIHDLSLSQDTNSLCSNGCRVAKCMKEYFIYKKDYRGALNSMLLAKSLHQKLWDGSRFLMKQLPGVGMVTAKALESMGVVSFETLAEADSRRIEIVTGRKYPFGDRIKESLHSLPPKVEMKVEELESKRQGKVKLQVILTRLLQVPSAKWHYAHMVVGLEETNTLIYHEKLRVDEFSSPYSTTMVFPSTSQGKLTVKAHLVFEEYIGVDLLQTLIVNNDTDSASTCKRGRREQSSSHAEQVYAIKDGSNISPLKAQNLENKFKYEVDSMPSFDLLDEDLEAALIASEADDYCQVFPKHAMLSAVHKKSMNYSLVGAADSTPSLSSEASKSARKPTHPKQLQLPEMDGFSGGKGTKRKLLQILASPMKEIGLAKSLEFCVNDEKNQSVTHSIIRSLDSINLIHDEGEFPQVEENNIARSKEETMFDHIRRKAKLFPEVNKANIDNEPILLIKESSLDDSMNLGHASRKTPRTVTLSRSPGDNVIILDPETPCTKTNVCSATRDWSENKFVSPTRISTSGARRSLDLPTEIFSNIPQVSSTRKPVPYWSSTTNESQLQPLRHPVDVMGAITKSCSLGSAAETGKCNSFLGFKSVFSFL